MLMLAIMFALIVAHLSLYPYEGWRHIGIGPFEYLSGPWIPVHQKLLWGDIILNVIAYIPLGFLLLLGLSELPKNAERIIAPFCAILLSFGLEALQTYLPTRVPSKMDVLTNTIGAILGSILAVWLIQRRQWADELNRTLQLWLIQKAWLGIALICLWLLALLAPRQPEFMLGLWLGNLFDPSILLYNDSLLGLPDWLVLSAEKWTPLIGNYCFLVTVLLIGLGQTREESPRIRLLILLVLLSACFTQAHLWINGSFEIWLTGVKTLFLKQYPIMLCAFTLALLLVLFYAGNRLMARLALIHLLVGWILSLFLPGLYPPELIQGGFGVTRALRDLQQAGRWIGEVWPLLGLVVLLILGHEKDQFKR